VTRRIPLVVLSLTLVILAGQAAGPPIPEDPAALALDQKLMAEAKKNSQLMANLSYLSDVIGHRLTGSASLERANHWTADKMKSYGLENVHLEAWTIPEGWERGKATCRLLDESTGRGRAISIAAGGWSPGTKGKVEGPVVFLQARTVKDLEPYKGKLKNAVVLMAPPSRVPTLDQLGKPAAGRQFAGGPFGGKGKDGKGRGKGNFDFTKGREMMGEFQTFQRELSAFLVKEGAAAIFRDSNKPLGLLVTTGSWGRMGPGGGDSDRDRASASNRVPTCYVAHNHYELLHRLATRPGTPPRVEIEMENRFIPGPIKVFNTVGEIKGSEKPEEFVVCGAHLDSWDLANGTTDNGTGSCIVLETARVIAASGVKPKRTIRFVLFTGEEQGLHGSQAYIRQHKAEMPRTAAAIVHDTGSGLVKGVGTGRWPAHKLILERELATLKQIGVTDYSQAGAGGSDHASFARAGVPGFILVQDMTLYTYTHHTQADTLDAAFEPNLIQGTQTMAVTAMRIANMNSLMPRVPQMQGRRGGFGGGAGPE
jgi:hypothetical protein